MQFEQPKIIKEINDNWPLSQKVSYFLLIIILTAIVRYFLLPADFPPGCYNVAVLIMLAVGFWITDIIPPFAVSMFVIGFSVYFLKDSSIRSVTPGWERYAGTWSSPVIWMMMGGFFISLGIHVTALDKTIANISLRLFGTRPRGLLLGIMLVTMLLSMLGVSNTATAAMMVAIFTPLAKKLDHDDPFSKCIFLGIAYAASFGGLGTIIASPMNAIAVQAAADKGITIGFIQWMRMGAPLALLFTIMGWIMLATMYRPKVKRVPLLPVENKELTPPQISSRWIVGITFLITLLLWLTTSITKVPVAAVSFVPMMLLTVTGVIQQKHIKQISWETLLLVAGGLTLGMAAQETGLLSYLTTRVTLPSDQFMAILTLSYLTVFISNFMSSTAAASILIPFANTLLPQETLFVSIVIGFSCSIGILLPISTPPNAIALSTGYITAKDFRTGGIFLLLVGPLIICYALRSWMM